MPPAGPSNPGLVHEGEDCWYGCGGGGACQWCGDRGACCNRDPSFSDPACTEGPLHLGCVDYHCCTYSTVLEACFEGVDLADEEKGAACAVECVADPSCAAIDLSGAACRTLSGAVQEERAGVHLACLWAVSHSPNERGGREMVFRVSCSSALQRESVWYVLTV